MNDEAVQVANEFYGTTNAFLAACRSFLSRIADCPAAVIAKQHPLGFVHFTIPFNDHEAIRLHIWPSLERQYQQPIWPIHDHNFTLSSRVIVGQIENSVFDVCPAPHGDSVIYEVNYADGASILTKNTTHVTSTLLHTKTYGQGMPYTVEQGTFHTSKAELSEISATIVIPSASNLNQPKVIGPLDGPNILKYHRQLCSDAHKHSLVEALLENLV